MTVVLDQYEVEYKESYVSGTYDQVVMGKMFYEVRTGGIKKYVYGNRGVVYGSIDNNSGPKPGFGTYDYSDSLSYSLQPYKEKSGNCKASKHTCNDELIYDSLVPDPFTCFKINGANVFISDEWPGESLAGGYYNGIDIINNAFIMFDAPFHQPDMNIGVDNHWTKSFPFEPRYDGVTRFKDLSFSPDVSYSMKFTSSLATELPIKRKIKGLIVGTLGRENVFRHDKPQSDFAESNVWNHYFFADTSARNTAFFTGSTSNEELRKILYGFGDLTTTFFDTTTVDSNNPTGYALKGNNNFPEFRKKNPTTNNLSIFEIPNYESFTGSYWVFNPIIRGWKYGLFSGIPNYTSAYFRQGRYGQFRDMLEQRIYSKFTNDKIFNSFNQEEGPVTVKFIDVNDNLTPPQNTQSSNLSIYATSSLPYFDLQQRNRNNSTGLTNISLINFELDQQDNIIM